MLFRDAPAAIRDEGVDSLIIDQIEMAGGTVAEHLGLPFVSAVAALPINRGRQRPTPHLPVVPPRRRWGPAPELVGNAAFEWIFSGILRTINRQRQAWGLPPGPGPRRALFSRLAQVCGTARCLGAAGLPTAAPRPPHRPLDGRGGEVPVDFPWSRLDPGRPLVYDSMGTLQNRVLRTFPGHGRGVAE